ncbi:nucleoside monophosphate kinase [Streptomyces sp. JNUCC 63]
MFEASLSLPWLRRDVGYAALNFPRTVRQAELLHETLVSQGTTLDCVLAFEVPGDYVVRRPANRRTCGDCGLTQRANPAGNNAQDSCQDCGGALRRRDDDWEDIVRKRLAVYTEQTAPSLGWYADQGLLTRVTATSPVEEMTRRALAAFSGVGS